MQSLVTSGVDLAIAVLVLEVLVLAWLRHRHAAALPLATVFLIGGAGLGLLIALRAALAGGSPALIAAGLSVGGIAHGLDLMRRMRAGSRHG